MADETVLSSESRFRRLPSVDRLVQEPALGEARWPRGLVVESARATLAATRQRLAGGVDQETPSVAELVAETVDRLERRTSPNLRRVINATGVVLHTNLGRAPM